jgi:hypothetical protein
MWSGKNREEFFRTVSGDEELKRQFGLIEIAQRKKL